MAILTTASVPASRLGSVRTKLMTTLFVAQVCGSTGQSIVLAVGSILAASITGTNTWSGLPVAVGALGTAVASWPLARLMARSGRRPGLALGYGLAIAGALLGMAGVAVRSFPLMLAGMALFGIASTSNLLARYAAADVSTGAQRGRAMGLIVWGSTVGSMIGPNLMGPALRLGALLGIESTASAFLVSVAGYALGALLIQIFLRPDPLTLARQAQEVADAGAPAATARSLGVILGDVRVQIALATLAVSQFVMISTTSTSPLYLHDQGHTVQTIGLAVSLHLAGMYVTSPLAGWLSDRFGRLLIIGAGAVILILAVLLAGVAPGSDRLLVILALFLNGVGWNMAFVAGSALLTDALVPNERASVQGLADLFMGLMGALGSAAGGMILGVWGFAILNAVGGALALGPLAFTLFRRPSLHGLSVRES
jgi:MFS family permease